MRLQKWKNFLIFFIDIPIFVSVLSHTLHLNAIGIQDTD